jgi:cell division protein FtsB
MKKLILYSLLVFLILSCENNERFEKLNGQLESLKKENDSLKDMVNGINDKYVFDSLIVRQIPHYANTNKLNSIYKEEIVFVGYNANRKTSVVIGDSTYFDNGMKVFNGDTLISKKGAFQHEIKLAQDRTIYGGYLKTENDYGKSYEGSFRSAITTVKN